MGLFKKKSKKASVNMPDLDGEGIKRAVQENDRAIIDFWHQHCAPCRRMEPVLEEIASRYPQVFFGRLNTIDHTPVAIEYGISAVPTFLFFRNGKMVGSIVGSRSRDSFEREMKEKLEV